MKSLHIYIIYSFVISRHCFVKMPLLVSCCCCSVLDLRHGAMESSAAGRDGDGLQDLTVNEVDVTLSKAMAHSNELVQRARQLQAHFQQAQRGMLEINRLCNQADSSIVQGQTLLNRSAHRIHELKQALERHQQALGTAPDISRWPCWDARCMTCGEVARMARFGSLKVGKCQEWLRKTWGLTAEHLQ